MLNPKERPLGTALYTQKCPKSLTNKFFFVDFFSFPAPYYQTFRRHLGQCASCVTPPPSPIHIPQDLRHLLYDLNQTILYLLCIYLFIYLSLQNWFGTAFSATRCLYLCIFCYHLPLFFFLFHVRKLSNRNFPIIFYLISPDWLLNKNAEAERVQHILSKQIFERKNNWQTKYFG